VVGPSNSLQQRRNPSSGPELTNQVDGTNVDPQLERSRCHEGFDSALPKPPFGVEAHFPSETPVVSRDCPLAQALAQMSRHAFGEPSGAYGATG
jgi:hypothetical protein